MSVSSITVTEFIKDNYTIIYQSETIESPEEADTFCLTETHQSRIERKINAHFIDTFSDAHSLVAVEMIPSMQEIQPQEYKQTLYVTKNIKTIGWDLGALPTIIGMDEETSKLYEQLENTELAQLKAYEKLSEEDISLLQKVMANPNVKVDSQALNDFLETDRQAFYSAMQAGPKLMTIDLPTKIKETFASRNSTMITTFEKTSEIGGRRLFIGGVNHFVENEELPEFAPSVQQLRDYLKNKKAIILTPRSS